MRDEAAEQIVNDLLLSPQAYRTERSICGLLAGNACFITSPTLTKPMREVWQNVSD